MRIRISHESIYRYDAPVAGVIQTLRLTPRNHDGQYVARWRIDVSPDAQLAMREDAFGNITHVFNAAGLDVGRPDRGADAASRGTGRHHARAQQASDLRGPGQSLRPDGHHP